MEQARPDGPVLAAQGSLVALGSHPACSASAHFDCAISSLSLRPQACSVAVPCPLMQAYQLRKVLWCMNCHDFLRRIALYMLRSFNAAKCTMMGGRSASFLSLQACRNSSCGCRVGFLVCQRLSGGVCRRL